MSVYGNMFTVVTKNNPYTLLEGTYIGEILEEQSIPQELKITDDEMATASKFKEITKKQLQYMKDNNFKPKKISATVKMYYFAIIGHFFYGKAKVYPICDYIFGLVKEYCNDKDKAKVRSDAEKTIAAIKKIQADGKTSDGRIDMEKNEAWCNDLSKNLNKLK